MKYHKVKKVKIVASRFQGNQFGSWLIIRVVDKRGKVTTLRIRAGKGK